MEKLQINNYEINIERKDVKNINIRVKPNCEIFVSAPNNIGKDELFNLICNKQKWIDNQIEKFKKNSTKVERKYISGKDHYLNGKRYILKLQYHEKGKPFIKLENKKIMSMNIKPNTSLKAKEKTMNEFYKNFLINKIDGYISKWSDEINVNVDGYKIRKMKTRWGSCDIQNHTLLFNLELAKRSNKEIEYVVVHELTHLKEKRHNSKYYSIIDKNLKNWREIENKLRYID